MTTVGTATDLEPVVVPLPHGAVFRVFLEARYVETVFADGAVCGATRDGASADNRREAAAQGYPATAAGVWASLVEHEIAHALVGDWLFGAPSPTLRHEAGAAPEVPYAVRLYEEAVAISLQRYRNDEVALPALRPFPRLTLDLWAARLRRAAAPVLGADDDTLAR